MSASPNVEMKHSRERVLEFESDLEKRLEGLLEIEQNILSLGQMRSRWLTSVSKIDEVETEAYHMRLDTLRVHTELATAKALLEKARLEETYETQALNYLIASTKPIGDGETAEERNRQLTQLARDNLENLRGALKESIDFRSKLGRQTHEHISTLAKYRSDHDNRHKAVVEDVSERIQLYAERMREAVASAKRQHHRITGEYLLLRHNARVAKEVLVRNQNEASLARKILQERLERLVEEAATQRERMETAAAAELKIMTDDIRAQVIQKEMDANHLRARIENLDASRRSSHRELRRDLRVYEKKYDALQRKRQVEVSELGAELKMLRGMIAKVERECLKQRGDDNFYAEATAMAKSELVASLEGDILARLKSGGGSGLIRPPPPPFMR